MNAVILALLIAALVGIQILIGGTRLVFSLPCYGVIGLAALLSAFLPLPRGVRWPRLCLLSTALLTGYIMLRARLSPVPYLAWPDYFEIFACAIVYGLVTLYFHPQKYFGWLLGALVLLAAGEVVLGVHQFASLDEYMLTGLRRSPMGHRASGLFISPNHFAGFLEITGFIALAYAFWSERPGWWRGLAAYFGASCFVGIALSGSRGGYVTTAAALVIFGLLSFLVVHRIDPGRAKVIGLAGAVLACLALFGAWQLMSSNALLDARLNTIGEQFTEGRRDWRFDNWAAAWQQSQLQPLTGTGAGTHLYYARSFRHPRIQSDPVHAHGDYLELLAEYGWVGAALMAFFLFAHLQAGWRRLQRAMREDVEATGFLRHDGVAIAIGLLVATSALILHSIVDFNLHIPGNALTLAAIFGLMAAPRRLAAEPPPQALPWGRAVLPLLGFWIAAEGLPKWPGEYLSERMRKALVRQDLGDVLAIGRRVKQPDNNPEINFYLGEANRILGTTRQTRPERLLYLQKAETAFRTALQLFPQDERVWLRLGQTLDAQGRYREAETAYLTAIQLDSQLALLQAFYAAHLWRRGNQEQARLILEKAIKMSDDSLHVVDDLMASKALPDMRR